MAKDGKRWQKMRALCALLLPALCLSCGIQSFEDMADLNPPLALSATVVGNTIELKFLSYNYENNFSGFNVFVGTESTSVNQKSKPIPNSRTENAPTFATNRVFREPTEITLVLTEGYMNMSPLKDMPPIFFIGVSAYDAVYRIDSKCSYPVEVDMRAP